MIRRCLALIAFAVLLSMPMELAMAGTTQVVAQFRYHASGGLFDALTMLWRLSSWENAIANRCGKLCFVDGHDFGSGTANVFIIADDDAVDMTVNAIALLIEERKLPEGIVIGVAEYTNDERTEWRYRPAYPLDLKHFDITYPEDPRGL